MVQKRQDIEIKEKEQLASYAAFSQESQGRVYPQLSHDFRTDFQRDRDRIIHCSAFRRLEYKTQVFIPHETDHYRTRLTHTIEVAQISRTIARILRLNEDLAEAIALVHDLGHTPFGHAGEDVLNELLVDEGGFNHNHQSLRIVDFLEQRYREHPGLNLTYEVREGIVKHETKLKIIHKDFDDNQFPSLEAMLVDIADEIAYNSHDIDDGLSSGLLTFELLENSESLRNILNNRSIKFDKNHYNQYSLVRQIINNLSIDVIEETKRRIDENNIKTINDVRRSKIKLCNYSNSMESWVKDLKTLLFNNLYRHEKLTNMIQWSREIITSLFAWFNADTNRLPERYQEMLLTEKKSIVIADYIAGMTDRFATKIYSEIK